MLKINKRLWSSYFVGSKRASNNNNNKDNTLEWQTKCRENYDLAPVFEAQARLAKVESATTTGCRRNQPAGSPTGHGSDPFLPTIGSNG